MAYCAYCAAETEAYYGEVPICLECSERRDVEKRPPAVESQLRARLLQDLKQTFGAGANCLGSFSTLSERNAQRAAASGWRATHPQRAPRARQRSHGNGESSFAAHPLSKPRHTRRWKYRGRRISCTPFSFSAYLSANSTRECLRLAAALLKLLRVGGVSPNTCPGIGASVPPNRRSPLP